jgi:hypothetical protein
MDELVLALKACWGPDPVNFDGEFFHIHDALVSPKPLQQPGPRLLSGMRSEPGLRRTAAQFDIFNPASGSVEQIQAAAERINSMRAPGDKPIEVIQRIFTEPPFVVPGLGPLSIEAMQEAVAAAAAAGFSEVVIDTAFTTTVHSPEDWIRFPDLLAPVLEALPRT